jgi:protein TonB
MDGKRLSAQVSKSMQPGSDAVYFEYQVEQPVSSVQGGAHPQYPDILKQAGVEGEVYVSFVVDTMGLADVTSLKVIKSSHQLFLNSVVAALPDMRFAPAMVGGRKVKQLVMEPFVFQLAGSTPAASKSVPGILKAPDRR